MTIFTGIYLTLYVYEIPYAHFVVNLELISVSNASTTNIYLIPSFILDANVY